MLYVFNSFVSMSYVSRIFDLF